MHRTIQSFQNLLFQLRQLLDVPHSERRRTVGRYLPNLHGVRVPQAHGEHFDSTLGEGQARLLGVFHGLPPRDHKRDLRDPLIQAAASVWHEVVLLQVLEPDLGVGVSPPFVDHFVDRADNLLLGGKLLQEEFVSGVRVVLDQPDLDGSILSVNCIHNFGHKMEHFLETVLLEIDGTIQQEQCLLSSYLSEVAKV